MDNRFVFIIAFRNVKDYIEDCVNSLLSQYYENWIAIFCDDASDDGTIDLIPDDERFIKRINKKSITGLPNVHNGISESKLKSEDIVAFLDGDDYLSRQDSIDIVNELYNKKKCLLTYGQFICYGGHYNGSIGICKKYMRGSYNVRSEFLASHLKTFKYKVYEELIKQDPNLNCYKDKKGNFYTMAADVAIMTPLLEICGFDNIQFNPIPIYAYRVHDKNECSLNWRLQKEIDIELFSKNKFKQAFNDQIIPNRIFI